MPPVPIAQVAGEKRETAVLGRDTARMVGGRRVELVAEVVLAKKVTASLAVAPPAVSVAESLAAALAAASMAA